jgi:hypothetical protein
LQRKKEREVKGGKAGQRKCEEKRNGRKRRKKEIQVLKSQQGKAKVKLTDLTSGAETITMGVRRKRRKEIDIGFGL